MLMQYIWFNYCKHVICFGTYIKLSVDNKDRLTLGKFKDGNLYVEV